jgi:GTP-binding protein HflX
LDEVRRHRALYQSQRLKASIPVVALVGYTNSGKSTLLNNLTGASVTVTNNLFSTLDPVTRRIRLPNGVVCLLTDTVGFISKLPPSVVAAFRATLDELHNAQLLLHIVDISGREAGYHYQTVEEILRELSLERKRKLTVVNKLDLVVSTERDLEDIYSQSKSFGLPFEISEDLIYVSAVKGWGLSLLLDRVSHCLPESNSENRQTAYYKQLSET